MHRNFLFDLDQTLLDFHASEYKALEILNDNELLFYNEYESFYKMTENSKAFENFCREAFGQDFSQDGFSDINQINRILKYIPKGEDVHILDVGCGNGKMLGYLQDKTGAYIHGFDYSESAIDTAKKLFQTKADFKQGKIGETDYPAEQFDLVVSMDSMYFAPDMEKFVLQIMRWLKKDGVLFVGYQEGDVMPKTDNEKTTVLARALDNCGIQYEVEDITSETYELLKKKRDAALLYQKDFEKEGNKDWLDLLLLQTDCVTEGYDSFAQKMARYIYVVRKNELGRRGHG
ncbi:class I SAM-dependent methyltransferase [Butyrivibrio sp. X503]|uniref:class I SAM-dependent methyltransferase n=1 Tax=Butyrivibrio sp. X503 TaxID=2364878 RepID=UPI0013148C01|nr:class I SAM-dependent methyltransferase [Butyrivibrio sp. X503]